MTVETMWVWIATLLLAIGATTGVWWALADFILDHVGPPPADWRGRRDAGAGGRGGAPEVVRVEMNERRW